MSESRLFAFHRPGERAFGSGDRQGGTDGRTLHRGPQIHHHASIHSRQPDLHTAAKRLAHPKNTHTPPYQRHLIGSDRSIERSCISVDRVQEVRLFASARHTPHPSIDPLGGSGGKGHSPDTTICILALCASIIAAAGVYGFFLRRAAIFVDFSFFASLVCSYSLVLFLCQVWFLVLAVQRFWLR